MISPGDHYEFATDNRRQKLVAGLPQNLPSTMKTWLQLVKETLVLLVTSFQNALCSYSYEQHNEMMYVIIYAYDEVYAVRFSLRCGAVACPIFLRNAVRLRNVWPRCRAVAVAVLSIARLRFVCLSNRHRAVLY